MTIALATLLAGWAALAVVIGATQPGGSGRVFAFATVVAVAAVVVAASALKIPDGPRAIALVAAGMAAAFTGVLGGFTVGLPLVPVGLTIILMGLTAAEGAAPPGRIFVACAAGALVVAMILTWISLIGR